MIFNPFERMMALRYLRARRKEGFVSVIAGFSFLGIALGVATLIIVMAVMNGFRQDIMSRILGVGGHIEVVGTDYAISDFDEMVKKIAAIPGVTSVMPKVEGQVMATAANGATAGALVRGVRGEDLAARPWIADHIVEGSLDAFTKGEGVLIGTRMAMRFGLQAGEQMTLISPNGNVTAFGSVPRMRSFTVAGVFNIGMSEFDSSFIFMPLEQAQVYFKYPDAVTNLEIRVENPDQARFISMDVSMTAGPGVRVTSWEQMNAPFFNALQVERNVMFMILTLIIIVAAFNIISGLIMLVKDKGRDIAILRTMGATRGMIMRIFFIAGASVGTIGTVLGFGLGLLVCDNIESIRQFIQNVTGAELFSPEIYYLTQMPAEMDWNETISVVVMSLVLSFAATLYPSWRAAQTDPVDALRYE